MARKIKVGLIGSGFMGRSHALALRMAPAVFGLDVEPELELLADVDRAKAEAAARALRFRRATGDWRELVADPAVDLVDCAAPNALHAPIALAAIAAGKPVYCEKPLAPDYATAKRMADAADAAGAPTFVGFNYLKNPLTKLAKEIASSGEIGEIIAFRGVHAEDYMADPKALWTWRLDPAGGQGALADLGSHIISLARHLAGPIESLCADLDTVHPLRPTRPGGPADQPVLVDDQARALLRFESGAKGSIEASWVAAGRKMHLAFELTGTKGALVLDMERMNELLLYQTGGAKGREGHVLIPTGPDHDAYAPFCPAPGHQLGFNDVKTIEVMEIMRALAGGAPFEPDFREAAEIQKVVDACVFSARERRWTRLAEW